MSKILTLEEIRSAGDLPRETVEVPEWGGAVVVQGLNVADGLAMLRQITRTDGEIDQEKAQLAAFAYGVIEPRFSADDMDWLKTKSLGAVTKVTQVFMRLSGFDAEAQKAAKKS